MPSTTSVAVGAAAGIGVIAATGIVSEVNDRDDHEMEVKKSSEKDDIKLECDAPVIVSDLKEDFAETENECDAASDRGAYGDLSEEEEDPVVEDKKSSKGSQRGISGAIKQGITTGDKV